MSEYTTLLERVGDRVAPPSDAFERLTTLRRRKHRNRRFGAGMLALVVAVPGIGGAYVMFHQTRHTEPVSGAGNFHAIFPAFNSVEAGNFQTALDKRWDPRLGSEAAVTERFGIDILGWSGVRVQLEQGGRATVSGCPPDRDCPGLLTTRLELAQLVGHGAGGAWFVTRADGTLTKLDLEPGQDVRAGNRITARVNLPNGTRVLAGYSYLGQSAQVFPVHAVPVHSGLVTFSVATQDFATGITHGPGQGSTSIGGGGGRSALTHPVSGIVSVAIPYAPRSHWNDPFGQYFSNRVVAIRDLSVPFGMNQGGPSGISFRSISAVPVRFIPAGAVSTDYFVHVPAGPGAIDSKGLTILDAPTNLPEGTLVSLYVSSKDEENPDTATVHDGMIPIRVANNYCHLNGGNLTGSAWTIEVTIAPMYPFEGNGVPVGPRGRPLPLFYNQPDSVLAILGQHFENLHGDQVTQVDGVNEIQISKDYQLPASTCTDRIVYLPGGDFRQVPVTPSP